MIAALMALKAFDETGTANMDDVIEGMGYDPRLGFSGLRPGPGWGGSCLPKDTSALARMSQDAGYDFPATENLTLNLGLRYEINPFYTGQRGQLSGFDFATGKLVIPDNFDPTAQPISAELVPLYKDRYVLASTLGLPNSIRPPDKRGFGPRVGVAWRPLGSNKWSVRSAYGNFSHTRTTI